MRICCLLALAAALAAAQHHVIRPGQGEFDGSRVAPGSTIAVEAGDYAWLRVKGLRGSAEAPIVIANQGGLVRIANRDRGYALVLSDCRHVRFSGAGHRGLEYGVQAEALKQGMFAIHVVDRSSDIEIDHVEVTGAGFAGFNVKDEPRAGSTDRASFVMRNIHLHHNYVHDVEGEGFYVGHTFYGGHKGQLPHVIEGLVIEHNRIENTGCEGIQVGSVVSGLVIADNVIIDPGQRPFAKWQDNGMQVNAAGTVRIERNVIRGAPGNGLITSSLEDDYAPTIAYNCISAVGGKGIYVGGKLGASGEGVRLLHNTVVASGDDGVRVANQGVPEVVALNNLIAGAGGTPWVFIPTARSAGNLSYPGAAEAGFVDPAAGDFDLRSGSPAVGRGTAIPGAPYLRDLAGRDPSRARAVDVGAYARSAPIAREEVDAAAPEQPAERPRRRAPTVAQPAPEPPADWPQQLAARVTAALGDGRRLVMPVAMLGGRNATVTGADGQGLTLTAGPSDMRLDFDRLPLGDAAALARELVAVGDGGAAPLAAALQAASGAK